jgi:hypothetical protein
MARHATPLPRQATANVVVHSWPMVATSCSPGWTVRAEGPPGHTAAGYRGRPAGQYCGA